MDLIKNILSTLLILLVTSSGLPVYMMEDASRDGTVDLQDAIMQVQDFVQSAEGQVSFSFRFEKMFNTLSSVAGLKSLIDPDKESKSSKHQIKVVVAPDKITNSFFINLPRLQTGTEVYTENFLLYESRVFEPTIPPPRLS